MLPFKNLLKFSAILGSCFLLAGCGDVQIPNLQQMMLNLSYSLPSIWNMVTGFAYILGMAFIMRGVYSLKVYGEMRTAGSMQQANLKIPLLFFIVGTALMFLPTTKSVFLNSTFGYGNELPLSYTSSNTLWNSQSTEIVLGIVQLVGVIAFIRGWVMLSHAQQQGGQNTFGKALTHIIGGIFAINIEGTRQIFEATFGINS